MKKLTSLLSIFAIVLLMTSVAFAQDEEAKATDFYFEDEDGPVFYITFPETWTGEWQEVEGASVLHALPKDESLYISIVAVHDAKDFKSAAEMIDAILAEVVTDYSFSDPQAGTLNDIPVQMSESKAKLKEGGEETELGLMFFTPKENANYILYSIGSKEAQAAHKDEIDAIFSSLRTKE